MDAPTTVQQPKGKFYAFENNQKRAGDNRPQFVDGQIELLNSGKVFALPAIFVVGGKKDGKDVIARMYGFTDPYPIDTPIRDRVAAKAAREQEPARAAFTGDRGEYLLKSGQYILWPNPDAGKPGKSGHPMTDMYGYWNPGKEYPIVKIGAWMGEKDGRGYINGETQLPLPGKEDGIIPDADPNESLELGADQDPGLEHETSPRNRRGRSREQAASR